MNQHKYLTRLSPNYKKRTKEIFQVNPTVAPHREEAGEVKIYVYDYCADFVNEQELSSILECFQFKNNNHITWINIDGLRKADVEEICRQFEVHFLLVEDILSVGQRPKMDEIENVLFCLLNMLYFNEKTHSVELEQISIVLGKDFVISFQDDASRDVFNPLREKLRMMQSKVRQSGPDYLCYAMIDMIVDNYYLVMEKVGDRIEALEEEIIRSNNTKRTLASINEARKELIILKRNVIPVRDLVNGFLKSDTELMQEKTVKYFKDVYDHIYQASDLVENYREMIMNMQDLYLSNVNLKLNEVMKFMAIVTCLLAPATVIGGIFGMNFSFIPALNKHWGFFVAVGLMVVIPIVMLWIFKHRGWFNNSSIGEES